MGLLLPSPLVGEDGRSSGEVCIKMENKVHQKTVLVQFGLVNFRPYKIGKNWIASGFRPRNDEKYFRPNWTIKYNQTGLLKTTFKNTPFAKQIWGTNPNKKTLRRESFYSRSEGFEPPTFWFVAKRSIQLGYERISFYAQALPN